MAKIAGRKNDGAWYRTNKDLVALSTLDSEALVAAITAADTETTVDTAYNMIIQTMQAEGINTGDFPTSATLWLTQLIRRGIPRQIWDGVTTYDLYTKEGGGGSSITYKKTLQPSIFNLSKFLRGFLKKWLPLNKEVKMLNNKVTPAAMRRELEARDLQRVSPSIPDPEEYEKRIAARVEKLRLTIAEAKSISAAPGARTARRARQRGDRQPDPVA